MIVSRNKILLVDYFDHSLELEAFLQRANKMHLMKETKVPKIHIQYVRQPYANGLGDAVLLGKRFAQNEPVTVLLPDDILINSEQPGLKQLIQVYEMYQGSVVALKQTAENQLKNYGVIKGQEIKKGLYEITQMVEKSQHSPPSKPRSDWMIYIRTRNKQRESRFSLLIPFKICLQSFPGSKELYNEG